MTPEELAVKIEQSPRLKKLQAELLNEVSFRADTSVQLDPILIVTIISIVVQIVIHCREKRSADDLIADIKDIRSLPPRRLIRLRRRLNTLWRNCCADQSADPAAGNPLLAAVYELGEKVDDETLQELIDLTTGT
jgi:hypothetical protein